MYLLETDGRRGNGLSQVRLAAQADLHPTRPGAPPPSPTPVRPACERRSAPRTV
ncbi:hypothetical protein L209DRAFT_757972 [Thermothelomyces heterothallicus CBS 203.75]